MKSVRSQLNNEIPHELCHELNKQLGGVFGYYSYREMLHQLYVKFNGSLIVEIKNQLKHELQD